MNKLLAFFLMCFGLYSPVYAAITPDAVGNWYLSKFPDLQVAVPQGNNPEGTMYDLCYMKANTDMRALPKDENETAIGEFTSSCFNVDTVNATQWIFSYNTAVGDRPGPFFLYAYKIESCAADEEYSKEEHSCVKKACVAGTISLLSGKGGPIIKSSTGPELYVADNAPDSTCAYTDGTKACTFNKPASSHSCFAAGPIVPDENGNPTSNQMFGHCNYEYINSGDPCTIPSGPQELRPGSGGYPLEMQTGEVVTCEPGVPKEGCGDGGTGGTGGAGDTGGTGSGGTGGTGSGGSGGTGSGGTGGTGSGGSGGTCSGGTGTGATGANCGGTGSGGGGTGTQPTIPSTASGGECSQILQCSGDAIQCGILVQQKKAACGIADLTAIDEGKVNTLLTGDKFNLEESVVDAGSLFQRTRFLPEACPAPLQMNPSFGSYTIDFEYICRYASIMSAFVVLGATLLSLMIIFKD